MKTWIRFAHWKNLIDHQKTPPLLTSVVAYARFPAKTYSCFA
jgi:hypothetical protein